MCILSYTPLDIRDTNPAIRGKETKNYVYSVFVYEKIQSVDKTLDPEAITRIDAVQRHAFQALVIFRKERIEILDL